MAGLPSTPLLLLSSSLLCLLLFCPGSSGGAAIPTVDELALLSFKAMLSEDSLPRESWNVSSTPGSYCNWPGVVCSRRHPDRVVELQLQSSKLTGRISPSLGNLSFLRVLNLGDNSLTGEIPPELGRLTRLRSLNMSGNSLQGVIPATIIEGCTNLTLLSLRNNMLSGMIPHKIGANLKNLVYLNLGENNLSGAIPRSLAALPQIEVMYFRGNRLSGQIPPALGNLTTLQELGLGSNNLSGDIPSPLGKLLSLQRLGLGANKLSGMIPTSIWNISSLTIFEVEDNILSGMIPPNAFDALPHLEWILMNDNQFHGHLPASLANASHLSVLQLISNFFSGVLPSEIGRLRNIRGLLLYDNLFETKEPNDWGFITALANCSRLRRLLLGYNKLTGALPGSFSNLSASLTYAGLRSNRITGSIPRDIGNLIGLQKLDLSENSFTGSLPSYLGSLKNMVLLDLHDNNLSGSVPFAIGNLTELNYLDVSMNKIGGRIPNTLGNLTDVSSLNLSNNKFTGPIPNGLFSIQTLSIVFDVSHNKLEGSIPQEIGHLKNLVTFHAESNRLSGEIPITLGECQVLQYLHLQNNLLSGSIPSALGELKSLETLDLSSNNLSGQIPMSLGSITLLQSLNLSVNSFVGEVPTIGIFANASGISVQGNAKLCGGIPELHLPPCYPLKNRKPKFPVVLFVSIVAPLAILSSIWTLLTCHKRSKKLTPSMASVQGHPLVSYSQLVKATDGFSPTNLLGSGSFGSVYKGEFGGQGGESTNLVAVKVLKLETPKALKCFTAECETLRNMRHRNLVKIVTICSSIDNRGNDFKAIVYDFMPNGSLEDWLHPDMNNQVGQQHLNLRQRVTILLDVACALDYLHCHGPAAPVVHCDVKSSNVLLDADMVSHVGDFGLARVHVERSSFMQQSTSAMGFIGTTGYAAPDTIIHCKFQAVNVGSLTIFPTGTEYGVGNAVSTKGDIYSYGILVLETVTGKRPTDSAFVHGLSIRQYVESGLHGGVMDVVDMKLSLDPENGLKTPDVSSSTRITECVVSLLRLGLSCSQELPSSRMPTGDIIKELHAIRESLSIASIT